MAVVPSVRAQPAIDPDRSLVVINARVHAAHPAGTGATALAVESGRLTLLGSDAAVRALRPAGARVVDAAGRWLIPGLRDLDVDLLAGGLARSGVLHWDGLDSLPAALARLRDHSAGLPTAAWVVIEAVDQSVQPWLSGLEAAMLDAEVPRRPVLVRIGPERVLLAPAAARRLGFEPARVSVLQGAAARAAYARARAAADDRVQRDAAVERHARAYARCGVTGVVDTGGATYPDDYGSLARLNATARLPVRVACVLAARDVRHEAADIARWTSTPFVGQGDRWLRLLGARLRATEATEIEGAMHALARARWAWRVEAPEPEAAAGWVARVDRVRERVSIDRLRWVVDLAQVPSAATLDGLRRLGAGACLSPARSPAPRAGALLAALGEQGIPVGVGSGGTRAGRVDPWRFVDWLADGLAGIGPAGTRAARERALAIAVAGNGWFLETDGVAGALAPGRPADFALYDQDPFESPGEALQSRLTVVDGRISWADGPYAGLAPAGASTDREPPAVPAPRGRERVERPG